MSAAVEIPEYMKKHPVRKSAMLRAPARDRVTKICKGVMHMRKATFNKKALLAVLLCVILTAVSVAGLAGCKNDTNETGFKLVIVHKDGTEKTLDLKSSKTTLADALLEKKLVEGDDSEYGLYIKTVDGETLDYNADGYYWSLLVNGEYSMVGVSSVNIEEGAVYTLKAENGM